MRNPEIRALARLDLTVYEAGVTLLAPVSRHFATATDDPGGKLRVCTPAILAQTVWTPAPPAVLVGCGAPVITCGIARVDMAKVARLMWPEERSYDPTDLAASMGFPNADYAISHTGSTKLALTAQAIAPLFSAVETLGDPVKLLQGQAGTIDNAPKSTIASSLDDLAGDERLEAGLQRLLCRSTVLPG